MPSLRRTYSSPTIRSSPYSRSRAGGHQPRRASGSDTLGRRVLADIDWWRVPGVQRDDHGPPPDVHGDENGEEPGRPLEADLRTVDHDVDARATDPVTGAGAGEGSAESTWQTGFGIDLRPSFESWTLDVRGDHAYGSEVARLRSTVRSSVLKRCALL
jgi:hypothetical protein